MLCFGARAAICAGRVLGGAVSLSAQQALRPAGYVHRIPSARLQGPQLQHRRRGEAAEPAPQQHYLDGAVRRHHGRAQAIAAQADRYGIASQSQLRRLTSVKEQ
jgi:hypothetical protein